MVFQASLVHRGSPNDSGTSIDGAGVYTELTKHGVIRQRRRATRARTGCLTCRSRHIKCDEGKPSCHQCTKSRRHCRGFSFGRPSYSSVVSGISAQDSVKTDQAILNVPIEEAVAQIPQYFEPEPPHWEQMEAIRYYRHYVLPLRRSRVMKNRHDYPSWAGLHDCYLLMQVATHQIATLYRVHGRLITAKNDPSMIGAWATLSRHMAQLIASVNTDLSNPTNFAHGKLEVFRKIFYLVYFDLAVNASTLGQHLRGFLALVEHIGGVQALIGQDDPQLNAIQRMMVLVGVGTNTTTPANKQIRGFEAYTDKNLIKLTSSLLGNQEFYNPAPLWIAGIRLTQLRSQVADGTCTGFSLKLAVEDLFNDISTFNAEEWAYSGNFGVGSLASSFARIFQVATRLYGVLSLPSSAIISWSLTKTYPRLPNMTAYDCVLISHQRKLLELLYLCRGTFASSNDLNWPLVVAGVSLASYGSVEDRNFIEESLLATWSNPLAMCSPLLCLEKLRIFWASGKTAWDDCFYELTPSIA